MSIIFEIISHEDYLAKGILLDLFEKELLFEKEKHKHVQHIFYSEKKFRQKEIARCVSSKKIILNEKYKQQNLDFWIPILAHEHCHVEQYIKSKMDFIFRLKYDIKRIIMGYKNLKEEKEAYAVQEKMELYLTKNKFLF